MNDERQEIEVRELSYEELEQIVGGAAQNGSLIGTSDTQEMLRPQLPTPGFNVRP